MNNTISILTEGANTCSTVDDRSNENGIFPDGESDQDDLITILSGSGFESDEDDRVTILSLSEFDFSDGDDEGFNTSVIQVGFGEQRTSNLNIMTIFKREYTRLGASGLRMSMKFKQPPVGHEDLEQWLTDCVTELLEVIRIALEI